MIILATRSARFAVLGLTVLLAAPSRLGAEDPPASSARIKGAPGMAGAVYSFFDARTGARTGQLKIGQVSMEYRSNGFMRVAWQPRVVLTQVDFNIGADMAWPAQGSQIMRTLQSLGRSDELALRDVRLHLAGSPGREIAALSARLRKGGVLELSEATVSDGTPAAPRRGTFLLWLAGPRAGQLLPAMTAGRSRPPGSTLSQAE